jgi:hypothetical protein
MKFDRNIVIPMIIIIPMTIFIIWANAAPAFAMILAIVIVILPILIIQKKTGNDWGKMFAAGILLGLVFMVLFIGILILSKHYEWLAWVVRWPHNY